MKWLDGWLGTLVEGAPLMMGLVRNLEPSRRASLAHLDPQTLLEAGVKGVIWDVDGTLLPPDEVAIPGERSSAVARLMTTKDLRHVILSNAEGQRQRQLAKIFPDVPILRAFSDRHEVVYHRRLGETEWWSRNHGVETPTLGLRPIRKPNLLLFRFALRELGVERPSQAIMIGDQHITDIAPANLLGMRSILVERCGPERFTRPVKLLQWGDARLAGITSGVLPRKTHGKG